MACGWPSERLRGLPDLKSCVAARPAVEERVTAVHPYGDPTRALAVATDLRRMAYLLSPKRGRSRACGASHRRPGSGSPRVAPSRPPYMLRHACGFIWRTKGSIRAPATDWGIGNIQHTVPLYRLTRNGFRLLGGLRTQLGLNCSDLSLGQFRTSADEREIVTAAAGKRPPEALAIHRHSVGPWSPPQHCRPDLLQFPN